MGDGGDGRWNTGWNTGFEREDGAVPWRALVCALRLRARYREFLRRDGDHRPHGPYVRHRHLHAPLGGGRARGGAVA